MRIWIVSIATLCGKTRCRSLKREAKCEFAGALFAPAIVMLTLKFFLDMRFLAVPVGRFRSFRYCHCNGDVTWLFAGVPGEGFGSTKRCYSRTKFRF